MRFNDDTLTKLDKLQALVVVREGRYVSQTQIMARAIESFYTQEIASKDR